jgi:hypothetical protein
MSTPRKRPRPAPERWPQQMWKVAIAEHHVPPRWDVPPRTVEVAAPTAQAACVIAVKWAHIDADIPPFRSMLAVSLGHTSATRSVTVRSERAA